MNLRQKVKGLILNLFTDYQKNPQRYWDLRWKVSYDDEKVVENFRETWKKEVFSLMQKHDCRNILDVGCGRAWLRDLSGYLGLDFSLEIFRQNKLFAFMLADATMGIPLPTKSFDASISCSFLMHQPPEKAIIASREMMRVTKRLILLREVSASTSKKHCFNHDYGQLFKMFDGKVVMLQW